MSSSALEVVSTTTGMRAQAGSALISASTSRPSLRGRLRSSRIRSGAARRRSRPRGAGTPSPRRRRRRRAGGCAPCCARTPRGMRTTSPGSSSTSSTSIGFELSCVGCVLGRSGGSVKRKREPGSPSAGLEPDAPAVVLDDLAAHREADAGARVARRGCRRWKMTKIRSAYSGSMPMPLSATAELASCSLVAARPTRAPAARLVAAELDRVADQVLEHEPQQRARRRRPSGSGPAPRPSRAVSSIERREVVARAAPSSAFEVHRLARALDPARRARRPAGR